MESEQVQKDSEDRVPDRPWLFRPYAGHSTTRSTNALYRKNLKRG